MVAHSVDIKWRKDNIVFIEVQSVPYGALSKISFEISIPFFLRLMSVMVWKRSWTALGWLDIFSDFFCRPMMPPACLSIQGRVGRWPAPKMVPASWNHPFRLPRSVFVCFWLWHWWSPGNLSVIMCAFSWIPLGCARVSSFSSLRPFVSLVLICDSFLPSSGLLSSFALCFWLRSLGGVAAHGEWYSLVLPLLLFLSPLIINILVRYWTRYLFFSFSLLRQTFLLSIFTY